MSHRDEWHLNFDSAPFCNGSLHLGHVRCYALGDVRARWLRDKGLNLRYATAYDAFGLPHQAGAAEAGLPTHRYVDQQINRIAGQLRALRLSYDLDDHPRTCDPAYYRWTQWLFVRLWRHGLVYRAERPMPYCEACCEYLAATQVEDGGCWRCGGDVSTKESEQWFIRTSDFSSVLADTVEELEGWSERAKNLMRAFLGRVSGRTTNLRVALNNRAFDLALFQPDGDELDAILLRANHPLAIELGIANADVLRSRRSGGGSTSSPLCRLVLAGNPVPVFAVPVADLPFETDAVSAGVRNTDATLPHLESTMTQGAHETRFRIHDWLVSRKRDWGTPLPAVVCRDCGVQPVEETDLPVRLPAHGGDGYARCSGCGSRQPTVTRNLDCFLDDAWCFWAAHPDWEVDQNPFELWLSAPPASVFFHSGYDSFVYLYLYRFLGRALKDMNLLHDPEIVDGFVGHDVVTADGRKMSKRHGNAPDLDALVRAEGPGVVRLAALAGANPSSPLPWSEDCLHRARRMLHTAERLRDVSLDDSKPGTADQRVRHRLGRAERFMSDYRVGSAIQEIYLATKDLLRMGRAANSARDELLQWWTYFAPGISQRSVQRPGHVGQASPPARR